LDTEPELHAKHLPQITKLLLPTLKWLSAATFTFSPMIIEHQLNSSGMLMNLGITYAIISMVRPC
jgi:hypothetical protein